MNPADDLEPPAARHQAYWEVVLKMQAARLLTYLGYPCDWQDWKAVGENGRADDWEYTHVRTTMQGVTIVQPVKSRQRDGAKQWYVDWDLSTEDVAKMLKRPAPARGSAEARAAEESRRQRTGVSSGDDLERRALAASAEARAQEQARQRQEQEEATRRQAEMVWRLRSEAAKRLEETLGHPSSPNDWEYEVHTGYSDSGGESSDFYSYPCVKTRLLGVDIVVMTTGRATTSGWEECLDWKLTLADFGKMLERKRQQEQR